jgi:hypothetical protein
VLGADGCGDVVDAHAVLKADDEPLVGEDRLDQLARPSAVVGLRHEEDEVELLPQCGDVAQVDGPGRSERRLLRHPDLDAARTNGLDVGGPLLDEGHIEAGADHVSSDPASLGTAAEYGDPLVH